jgi:hypothetical protein
VVGIIILRALLYRFHNSGSGLCCPSYRTLQEVTGLCRQSIGIAIARLERAGVLVIVRRLCRQQVRRLSPITGEPEDVVTTTQATNLYRIEAPGAWSEHLSRPAGKAAPFPSKRQMDMLRRTQLFWVTKLSLGGRKKPRHTGFQMANLLPRIPAADADDEDAGR